MEHEWAAVEEEEEEETHFASNGDDDDNDDDDDDNDISCRRATRIIVVVSAAGRRISMAVGPPSEPVRTLDVVRILCPSWSSPLPPSSPMTPRLLLPAVKHPHHLHHRRTTVITAARSLVSSSFRG